MSLYQLRTVSLDDLRSIGSGVLVRQILRDDFLLVEGAASEQLMDDAEGLTQRLFTEWSLWELEERYGRPSLRRQRGLTAKLGVEQAAARPGEKERPPGDMKVFGMFRMEEWPDNMAVDAPFGPNLWPDEILPEFKPVMLRHMQAQMDVYMAVLGALEEAYGFSQGFLQRMARGAESVARNIFYPGSDLLAQWGIEVPEGALQSAPHEDINGCTVLRLNKGLYLQRHDEWKRVDTSNRRAFGVNVGEMICKVAGIDDLVPTTHCVGAPPGVFDPEAEMLQRMPRVAILLFGHFLRSTELRPGLRTGDWFDQRIQEITQG